MGVIYHGHKKEHWEIINKGILKYNNEFAYNIKVGEWNDYDSYGYLNVCILKETYDKIINGGYIVKAQTIFRLSNLS